MIMEKSYLITGGMLMDIDSYGLELAKTASLRSKDPSTNVGAAILDHSGRVVSLGYNGTCRGVNDEYWMHGPRDRKLAVTIHAELNSILNARSSVEGCTIYIWPLPPCCHCASVIAQSGIARVVCNAPKEGSRWQESADIGRALLEDAGVGVFYS